MKVLVINNYDSFVYNLVHMLHQVSSLQIDVVKNDEINFNSVGDYEKVLLSPGPGIPSQAGLMIPLLKKFSSSKSILGVCLGHQAIAESFGGSLFNLSEPLHGVSSVTSVIKSDYLFENVPELFNTGHYHSWVVHKKLPPELEVTAFDKQGNIMALKHQHYDVRGVQFHPESILTDHGKTILQNWINH